MSEEREYRLRGPAARQALRAWWKRLLKEDGPGRPPRRGDRAQLRRCRTPGQVAMDKAFNDLLRDLRVKNVPLGDHPQGLAAAALVLMDVRDESAELTLGQLMAAPGKNPKQGAVSGLRFRRLLAIDDLDELTQALIRVVRLCGDKAPVTALASDIFEWADPEQREKIRQNWAREYYAHVPDAGDEHAA
ncbi:MAG: type I-E CRISPR-associated protein Cse2/CasB [Thermodesulfobacteriota bacterium]